MDAPSNSYPPPAKKPCAKFAAGTCTYGDRCKLDHPYQLDPKRREENSHKEPLPNELGLACKRCIQQLRACDKAGREGDLDVCSECRHFGGPDGVCQLDTNWTYNDKVWTDMLVRQDYGYVLANPKDRLAPVKKTQLVRGPMPDDKVKPDWRGETRDQLLAKPDFLGPDVRQLPRAYLVPPRLKENRIARNARNSLSAKRKAESYPSSAYASIGGFDVAPAKGHGTPASFSVPQPPPLGAIMKHTVDFEHNQAIWEYESGGVLTMPILLAMGNAGITRPRGTKKPRTNAGIVKSADHAAGSSLPPQP